MFKCIVVKITLTPFYFIYHCFPGEFGLAIVETKSK